MVCRMLFRRTCRRSCKRFTTSSSLVDVFDWLLYSVLLKTRSASSIWQEFTLFCRFFGRIVINLVIPLIGSLPRCETALWFRHLGLRSQEWLFVPASQGETLFTHQKRRYYILHGCNLETFESMEVTNVSLHLFTLWNHVPYEQAFVSLILKGFSMKEYVPTASPTEGNVLLSGRAKWVSTQHHWITGIAAKNWLSICTSFDTHLGAMLLLLKQQCWYVQIARLPRSAWNF